MSAKQRDGIRKVPTKPRLPRILRQLALFFSVIAVLIVSVGFIAFREADKVMRFEPVPLQTIASNIMPRYSLASFMSIDGQTSLSGWLFPARGEARSTIIMVHDILQNRLQFGLDTPFLFEELTESGFNVLAFDLRHSGQSAGPLSGYGYAEWEDVVAAISYVRKNTATRDVILYGLGSGSSAVLLALDHLPDPDAEQSRLPLKLQELGFDKTYVKGIMLDSPAASADSYISALYKQGNLFDRVLLKNTVPYAVRMSAGSDNRSQLTTVLTRQQLPVFISYSKNDNRIGSESIEPLVREQLRLHPDTTLIHKLAEPGSVAGFMLEREAYLATIADYFRRFFD